MYICNVMIKLYFLNTISNNNVHLDNILKKWSRILITSIIILTSPIIMTYLNHSSRTVSISEEAFEAENAHSNYHNDDDHSDNHTSYPWHSPSDFTLIQGFPTLAVAIALVASWYTLSTSAPVLRPRTRSCITDHKINAFGLFPPILYIIYSRQ